ncbi:MAG: pyrroline-5-carboxylate reductase [Ruminococcaceae bacterium]|nr:pyrroline-5-carboxylate reductase [Oscillospiraceae bacterium]
MKYGFIGCGNMGGALARALAKTTKDILLSDYDVSKAITLAEEIGCRVGTNEEVVSRCDRVFVAVKPQMAQAVLGALLPLFQTHTPLLISMAAGLTTDKIETFAGGNLPVIRIMPNTPAGIGKGLIMYCKNKLVTDADVADFVFDMRHAGTLDALDEKYIDAGTSVSGCGPAFMYLFLEALADGGVACGLPRDKAMLYAATTMAGAAEMVLQSGKHPGELKDAVCSPGGSTIMGVKALEDHGLRSAAINAVMAAFEKNKELGK